MTLQELTDTVDQQIRETGAPVAADWDALKAAAATRPVLALSIDRAEFEQFVVDYDAGDRLGGMFVFAEAFIRKFQPPGAVSSILTVQGRYTAEATIRYLYGLEKQ